MSRRSRAAGLVCLLLLALPALLATADSRDGKESERVQGATNVFRQVTAIPDRSIPDFLLRDAHAIAIIPGMFKVGFVVGGQYGQGVLLRQQDGRWSDPLFITVSGGSVGWQIGVQSTDIVLVFRTDHSLEDVLQGKFTIGVDVAAAAGPVGRSASALTDVQLKAEVYSYSRSRGFFAGLSLDGTVLQIDDSANHDFYGERVSAEDILQMRVAQAPQVAQELVNTLEMHSRSLKQ
jgi:lipid-binding SYLF domain-containing protein